MHLGVNFPIKEVILIFIYETGNSFVCVSATLNNILLGLATFIVLSRSIMNATFLPKEISFEVPKIQYMNGPMKAEYKPKDVGSRAI